MFQGLTNLRSLACKILCSDMKPITLVHPTLKRLSIELSGLKHAISIRSSDGVLVRCYDLRFVRSLAVNRETALPSLQELVLEGDDVDGIKAAVLWRKAGLVDVFDHVGVQLDVKEPTRPWCDDEEPWELLDDW
jgi:hypothetical protein